jgi:hypothetical protein
MPIISFQVKDIMVLLLLICLFHVDEIQSQKAFYIGHSLSDQIPDMVKSLADDHPDVSFQWAYQSIPGAPLRWQWERKEANDYDANPPQFFPFYHPSGGLPSGTFDMLVLTEGVPRYGDLIEETYQYADSFFRYANAFNPGIRVYLYEDWHCILSGTPTGCDFDVDSNPWRQRIEDDLPMWESVVDTLNARYNPVEPVCLIPAAQGLAQVYDSIYAGNMPGLNAIDDLFSDRIHLNDIGKYFVACVHFSTLFEVSPVGLTHQLQHWWGGEFEAPAPELALKFQEIAWSIANTYPGSCLSNTTNVEQRHNRDQKVTLHSYPNPFQYATTVQFEIPVSEHVQISLLDLFGKKRRILLDQKMPKGQHTFQLKREGLVSGTYLCQLKIGNVLLTKKLMIMN